MYIFKKNKILLITISILIFFAFFAFNDYISWWNQYKDSNEKRIEICTNSNGEYDFIRMCESVGFSVDRIEECKKNQKEQYPIFCERILNAPKLKQQDTINLYFDILATEYMRFFQIISPLLVSMAAVYHFHSILKSGSIKNVLLRIKYKKFMKENVLKSWKYSLIIPIFLMMIFLISYTISGHFNFFKTLKDWGRSPYINLKHLENTCTFIFVYISNFILHSIFSINLFYIVSKKSKNFILSIISFFITYIGIFIIQEVFIGTILLGKLLKLENGTAHFNFSTIWLYERVDNLFVSLLVTLAMVTISTLVLIKVYKNKEEVLLNNEI